MSAEPKIKAELSERIKKKIEGSECPDEVKRFLHEIILLELEQLEKAKPRVLEEYESLIKKYAEKWRVIDDVD